MPDSLPAQDLSGYSIFDPSDPFEDHIGPIYHQRRDEGVHCALPTHSAHTNAGGVLHGGLILSFADYALCATCGHAASGGKMPGSFAMTVSLTVSFLETGTIGPTIESMGESTRVTGRMAFARGSVFQQGGRLATYSGVTRHIARDKAMGRRAEEGLSATRPPAPPLERPAPEGYRRELRTSAYLRHTGPTFFRDKADGVHVIQPTFAHMLNSGASVHGGMLMTFADNALCTAITSRLGKAPSTVMFTAEFLSAGTVGAPLETRVDIARASERFAFPTGTVTQGGAPLLNYSAVVALREWKRPS